MIFLFHANKTLFHKKCFALGNVLKLTVFETRKWLIPSMPITLAPPGAFVNFLFFSESCKFATLQTRNRGPWKFVSLQINVVVVVVKLLLLLFLKTSAQIEESLLLQVDAYRFSRVSWELNESLKITTTKKTKYKCSVEANKQKQMGCLREF